MSNPLQSHLDAARALHAQGRLQEAEQQYLAAQQMAPGDPSIAALLGMLCVDMGRYEEAQLRFEHVLSLRPDIPVAHLGLANALLAMGRPAEALAPYERFRKLEPANPAGPFGMGSALQTLGRIADARKCFEQAVALAPDFPSYQYPLAAIARFTENDPRLAALERLAKEESRFPEAQTVDLHFALGKAFDDLGRYEEAFAHYQKGNAIRRRQIRYDEGREMEVFRALTESFTPELFAPGRVEGDPSREPVFIVGMPRSGSSLVEQILASHPQMSGAGELTYLAQLIDAGLAGRDFPFGIASLESQDMRKLGGHYAAAVRRLAPQAARIIDKAPANFRLVGLIRLALPNARIIHVRRDARDTCLSCYFNLFAQAVNFSYELGELGRYYRAYERLMAHWRSVLPAGAMLEINYEALVGDLESESRRLVDYCGLDWNERCLSFHRTERVVHTVSAAQVRQPVYASSVGRWRPYEKELGPLIEALTKP